MYTYGQDFLSTEKVAVGSGAKTGCSFFSFACEAEAIPTSKKKNQRDEARLLKL
jgi:hypothetical protein